MTRLARIHIDRVEVDPAEDYIDIELEDNQSIIRAVLTKPTGSSGVRTVNVYVLTDPVAEEEQIVGTCIVCERDINKMDSWISEAGQVRHSQAADCMTNVEPLVDATADAGSGTAPEPAHSIIRETHDLDQQ